MKCQNLLANIVFQNLLQKEILKSLHGPLNSHKYIHVSCKPGFFLTGFPFFFFK